MKNKFFSPWLGFLACLLLVSSCCAPCEKPNLGQFTIKEGLDSWLAFAPQTVNYKASTGESMILTFSEKNQGFLPLLDNCDEVDRCGICCNEFESEFMSVEGVSDDLSFFVEISIQKDFLKHNANEKNENISEFLEVKTNNMGRLVCRLENLAEVELIENITLNGQTYAKVWKCEDPDFAAFAEESQVTAIYFSQSIGLLGWRTGEDKVWGIQ